MPSRSSRSPPTRCRRCSIPPARATPSRAASWATWRRPATARPRTCAAPWCTARPWGPSRSRSSASRGSRASPSPTCGRGCTASSSWWTSRWSRDRSLRGGGRAPRRRRGGEAPHRRAGPRHPHPARARPARRVRRHGARAAVHDTVGEDLVNHCVTDVLVHGARPLAFLDYIATGTLEPAVAAALVDGVARACRAHEMTLAGGETAQLPDLYQPGHYDLAGTIVGVVEERDALHGDRVRPGDVLLGYASTGLHTNGYTLARRIVFETLRLDVDAEFPDTGRSVAQVLLDVHRSYAAAVTPALARVHALAHVTGGGIPGNLVRVLPDGCEAVVDAGAWRWPAVFRVLMRAGGVSLGEMRRVFNLGIGMIAIVARDDVEAGAAAAAPPGVGAWDRRGVARRVRRAARRGRGARVRGPARSRRHARGDARAVRPSRQDATLHGRDPRGGSGARRGGAARPRPRGARRRRVAAAARRGRRDRVAGRAGGGAERAISVRPVRAQPPVRRPQARDLDRRPHRGCRGPLAMGLGRGGARLRALAARRVRRHRRGWHYGAAGQSPSHRARHRDAAQASGARRLRPPRHAQPRRHPRRHRARSADLGDVLPRGARRERHRAGAERRARLPAGLTRRRPLPAARGRDPVGVV